MDSLRRSSVTAVALVVIIAWFVHLAARPPAAVPATAPATEFSAERAIAHVRAITERPHPSGSVDHARVREYLLVVLTSLGLSPQVQETTGVGTRVAVAAHVFNVLARVPGRTAGGSAVLVMAHYDSQAAGPGAGDDAAGVAAVLETVRALRAGPPLAHDVIVLFTDAEEFGLVGAAAFTREHPWAKDVAVVLNFEGRGTTGPSLMFETGPGNLDLVTVLRAVPSAVANSLSVTVYRLLPNDTDLSELALLEQPAMNFSFIDGLARYHTSKDDAVWLDAGSVQHHGVQALALTRALADGPLPRPRTGDAVFATVPGLGLVVYPEWLAKPLAGVAVILAAAVLMALRPRDPHWLRGVLAGIAMTILSAIVAAAIAYGTAAALERALGVFAPTGWKGPRAPYAIGMALLAWSIAAGGWAIARRWAAPAAAHAGALVVWLALAIAVTWALPGASFLFLWPFAAVAIAALVTLLIRSDAGAGVAIWLATLATASILVQIVYALAVVAFAMTGPAPAILALFVAISGWLLAPHLETIAAASSRRWAAAAVLFAASLAALVVTIATAGPRAETPAASMLAYAVDADSPGAWLVTRADLSPAGSWSATALGPSAQLVVPRTAGSSGAPPEWLTRAAGDGRMLVAPAPPIAIGGPDINVLSASPVEGGRRLELRVIPAPGTHSIHLRAGGAANVISAAVDGRAIDPRRYRRSSSQWTLGFVAPPLGGFELTLTVGQGPLELDVIARTLGLAAVPGLAIPPRPDAVVPAYAGDQTVVHRRFRF